MSELFWDFVYRRVPVFNDVSGLRIGHIFWGLALLDPWPLKMRPIGFSETSVNLIIYDT